MAEDRNENNINHVQQQSQQSGIIKNNPLQTIKTSSIPLKLEYAEDKSKKSETKGDK